MEGLAIVSLTFAFVAVLIGVGAFVLWLWALVEILKSEFSGNNKLVWLLAVIFIPLAGAILYFVIGRSQRLS